MNATDQHEYIVQGFKDLIARLEHPDEAAEISTRIRLNTAARERALERVRAEYAAYGLVLPCGLALSITARRVMAEVDAERNRTLAVDQPATEAAE